VAYGAAGYILEQIFAHPEIPKPSEESDPAPGAAVPR
jgi:hypothetical protein